MSVTDIAEPIQGSHEAYLNGVMVGISYVVETETARHGWIYIEEEFVDSILFLFHGNDRVEYREGANCFICRLVEFELLEFSDGARVFIIDTFDNKQLISATPCHRCSYFVPYPFNTCNAFHPMDNVTKCQEFRAD